MRATATIIALAVAACGPRTIAGVSVEHGNSTQQASVAQAALEAEQVYADPAFWSLVDDYIWIPAPGKAPMPGPEVSAVLRGLHPKTSQYELVWFYGKNVLQIIHTSANAQTGPGGPVQIYRRRVPAPHLLNTIAHETTHLAVDRQKHGIFLDKGYSDVDQSWLVSYGIGDLAECYFDAGGNSGATKECFDQVIDGAYGCRPKARCCGDAPKNVLAARELAHCPKDCLPLEAACTWHAPPR